MLDKRTKPNSVLWFNVKDEEKEEAIKTLLDSRSIDCYFSNTTKDFSLTTDEMFIENNKDIFLELHNLKYREFKTEE